MVCLKWKPQIGGLFLCVLHILGQEKYWVNPSKRGGRRSAGRAAPRDFPRAKVEGNPEEQENPVHPDSFTWIYIIFKIGHFGDISDFSKY